MRYPKGSIVLSESLDVPLLWKTFQAGHATGWQLFRALNPVHDQARWKHFLRRLAILSDHEFLHRMVIDGMERPVFALGEHGARSVQGRMPTIVEARTRESRRGSRDHVWHDVELFELHLQLRQSGVVLSWIHEPEIRADNELTTFGYVKDYDAIVTFQCGQKSGRIALEYERTPKSSRQYARIAELLDRESRVDSVLYLVPNVQLESFLLHCFRQARRPVYVCQAHEFASKPAEAALIDVSRQSQRRLADCLSSTRL